MGCRITTDEQFDELKLKKLIAKKSEAMYPDKKAISLKKVSLVIENEQKVTFERKYEEQPKTHALETQT